MMEDSDKASESLLLEEDMGTTSQKVEDLDKNAEALLLEEDIEDFVQGTGVTSEKAVEPVEEASIKAEASQGIDESILKDEVDEEAGETGISMGDDDVLGEIGFISQADTTGGEIEASLDDDAKNTVGESLEEADEMVCEPGSIEAADNTVCDTTLNMESNEPTDETNFIGEDHDAETSINMESSEPVGETGVTEETDGSVGITDFNPGTDNLSGETGTDNEGGETIRSIQVEREEMTEDTFEDVEMGDAAGEDSKNNNLAPDVNLNMPATDLNEAIPEGTLSNTKDYANDQFISQTESIPVMSEPPQQLMEDADDLGYGESSEDVTELNEEVKPADTFITPDVDVKSGSADSLGEGDGHEIFMEEDNETLLLEKESVGDVQNEIGPSSLEAPLDEAKEGVASQLEEVLQKAEDSAIVDQEENADEAMDLPVEDGALDGGGTFSLVSAGDQLNLQDALGSLNGRLVLRPDGTVHLVSDQDNLQGIQLMEEDDKPEGEAASQAEATQQDIEAQLHEALLKQEEIKKEEEEEKRAEAHSLHENDQANSESDPLATLASAALDHQAPANGVKTEPEIKAEPEISEPQWMDVGICKGTHCVVRTFYIPSDEQTWDKNWNGVTTSTLPDHRALAKLELESGKAYKFRVAAINSCGRGPWSEISAFRTSMPGVPGAPSNIKISKTVDGAHVTWEPPSSASGVIEDYIVYMAVKVNSVDSSQVRPSQLSFIKIYQGQENQCSVINETLSEAHIDVTTKPAILFRIAARNDRGLGPAIQVRWLQDVNASGSGKVPVPQRRPGSEILSHLPLKRNKSDFE